MQNKIILFSSFLIASSPVFAAQHLQEGAVQGAATAVSSEAAEKTTEAAKVVEKVENLKEAPEAVKVQAEEKAKDAAKEGINEATPKEAKQGVKDLQKAKKTTDDLKGNADSLTKSPSKAVKAVKGKAAEKTTEKALDLLR